MSESTNIKTEISDIKNKINRHIFKYYPKLLNHPPIFILILDSTVFKVPDNLVGIVESALVNKNSISISDLYDQAPSSQKAELVPEEVNKWEQLAMVGVSWFYIYECFNGTAEPITRHREQVAARKPRSNEYVLVDGVEVPINPYMEPRASDNFEQFWLTEGQRDFVRAAIKWTEGTPMHEVFSNMENNCIDGPGTDTACMTYFPLDQMRQLKEWTKTATLPEGSPRGWNTSLTTFMKRAHHCVATRDGTNVKPETNEVVSE